MSPEGKSIQGKMIYLVLNITNVLLCQVINYECQYDDVNDVNKVDKNQICWNIYLSDNLFAWDKTSSSSERSLWKLNMISLE